MPSLLSRWSHLSFSSLLPLLILTVFLIAVLNYFSSLIIASWSKKIDSTISSSTSLFIASVTTGTLSLRLISPTASNTALFTKELPYSIVYGSVACVFLTKVLSIVSTLFDLLNLFVLLLATFGITLTSVITAYLRSPIPVFSFILFATRLINVSLFLSCSNSLVRLNLIFIGQSLHLESAA